MRYITPTIRIHIVKVQPLLSDSVTSIGFTETTGNNQNAVLSKKSIFDDSDFFGEDEE